jgi:hypothetical protein
MAAPIAATVLRRALMGLAGDASRGAPGRLARLYHGRGFSEAEGGKGLPVPIPSPVGAYQEVA